MESRKEGATEFDENSSGSGKTNVLRTLSVILKHHTDDKHDLLSSEGPPQWATGAISLLNSTI